RERVALGAWSTGRFDADDFPDFATVDAAGLTVFGGDEHGRFDPARSLRIDLPQAAEHRLEFVDFNRDGRMDVLAVHRPAGRAVVLLAHPERGLQDRTRLVLTVPGYMRRPVVDDLDGDGFLDIALPYVPTPSVGAGVRIFFRGEVQVKVPLFLNRGRQGSFRRSADRVLTLPVRVRLLTEASGRFALAGVVVVEHRGDLDGDGRRDLLVTRDPDVLGIHRGVPGSVYEERPSGTVRIPDPSAYASVRSGAGDLNGDGRSDILLQYRGRGDRPDRLVLLVSRKN
ncbi:MAG: FG-GAP repeat domain-containing protein, partial [Planctomycetota bacterium]